MLEAIARMCSFVKCTRKHLWQSKSTSGGCFWNTDIAKTNKRNFVVERWMQCLLLRLKSEKNKFSWATAWLLVPRVNLLYLVDEFFFCSWFHRFCFWCSSDGMWKGGESKSSFCYLWGLTASSQTYRGQGGVIQCVWSVCRWLDQWWLVFVLLGVDGTLGDGGGIWEYLHREVKCIQGYCKTLWMSIWDSAVEHSVVVMTSGPQSRRSQIEDSDTDGLSSLTVRMEY